MTTKRAKPTNNKRKKAVKPPTRTKKAPDGPNRAKEAIEALAFNPNNPRVIMAQNLCAAAVAARQGSTVDQALRTVVLPLGSQLALFWLTLADMVTVVMVKRVEEEGAKAKAAEAETPKK